MTITLVVLAIAAIVFLTIKVKLHPFLALLFVSIAFAISSGMTTQMIIQSISEGFGGTMGKIGLVIVIGVMIGTFLENSGGAYKLAEKVLNWIGRHRVPWAMGYIGYFVSIPVFADSGFIVMSALNKSLTKKAGLSITVTSIALALGLMTTHTLVPPTPGPVAAAGILEADLGLVILMGLGVAFVGTLVGIVYSLAYPSRTYIEPQVEEQITELKEVKTAPGALHASLPIIIPIQLIVFKSFYQQYKGEGASVLGSVIDLAGEPVIALLIGLVIAWTLPRKWDRSMISTEGWVGKAVMDSATILLITGAGGVFGKMLQNSGVANELGLTLASLNIGIWLPFILSAAIKTAQGSSTVALITVSSIMAPIMVQLGFTSEMDKVLVVLAIGAGSIVISHANDSFFWVVTQLSGMDVKQGYRMFSFGTFVMGTSVAFIIFLIFLFTH